MKFITQRMQSLAVGLLFALIAGLLVGCGSSDNVDDLGFSSDKDIIDFVFTSSDNPQLASDIVAAISMIESDNVIELLVPADADVTDLVPTITHTGSAIDPASGTAQDFTDTVTYTVTAEDESTQTYWVYVVKPSVLVVAYDNTAGNAMASTLNSLGVTQTVVTDPAFRDLALEDLFEYSAVFYAGLAPTESLPYLVAYLDAGGLLYISDNDLGFFRGTTNFYNVYLQATYHVDDGGERLEGESIMFGLNLDIPGDPWPDGFVVGDEGTRIFKYANSTYAGGVAVDRRGYRAIYTAFDFNYIITTESQASLVSSILNFLLGFSSGNATPS
jgi:hypothetical protein